MIAHIFPTNYDFGIVLHINNLNVFQLFQYFRTMSIKAVLYHVEYILFIRYVHLMKWLRKKFSNSRPVYEQCNSHGTCDWIVHSQTRLLLDNSQVRIFVIGLAALWLDGTLASRHVAG